MDKQKCPFCDSTLSEIEGNEISNTKSFYCDTCDLEFIKYPSDNKKGVQRTGLYVFIPLAKFSKEEWENFLFTERNSFGEEVPDRLSSFASSAEKDRMRRHLEQKLQKRREWEEQVG